MTVLLQDKTCIIYGAGGAIGGAVARPVTTGLMSTFNTARAAARLMAERGSGVILSLTSGSARGSHPMMGGTGPADAATEAFLRYLAAEMVRAASASPASTPRAWPGR